MVLLKFILNDSFLAPRLGEVDTNFLELGFVVCPWSLYSPFRVKQLSADKPDSVEGYHLSGPNITAGI